MERLHKFMARAGVASLRQCEELISSGLVKLNGKIINRPGVMIEPATDKIEVNGSLVKEPEVKVYILLYKPKNCVTTINDPQGRPKVADLIADISQRVYPVGRLDYDSEGLLLMTNDGQLTYFLTHPRHHVPKTYLAWVAGIPAASAIDRMEKGLVLSDGPTSPAGVRIKGVSGNETLLEITIYEGRKRQIRRMCDCIGHPVNRLKRIGIGFLTLGNLKPGKYRFLTSKEIKKLKKLVDDCLKKNI